MTARHFDVVVLGRSLGALSAAALLARRDFRVLLLGQGQRPPSYEYERFRLKRRAFTLLFGASPVWSRMLHELAQSPRFRRMVRPLDPMFVVSSEGRHLEVPPEMELFAREIDREFPEVRQLVDELYSSFAQVNAAVDAVFEKDAVWPPGTLWERIETRRASALLPLVRGAETDLLGKFPVGHPYREIVTLPPLFATSLFAPGDYLPPLALARLHGSWTRGIQALERGEDELEDFLLERIEAHGGECRLSQRATALVVRLGKIAGVLEDGEEEITGADSVVTDLSGEAVADLSGGDGITAGARRDWPRLTASAGRFVVCLVVKRAALPDPLGAEAFLTARSGARPDPRRPAVHLQRLDTGSDESTLVAETVLPLRGPLTVLEAREAVLATLREHLPFLDDHILIVDSPHDGLPLLDSSGGSPREMDRIHLTHATAGTEPMQWLWSVEPTGYLDLGGEPIRGPIPGTFLVGSTVLPALGQEGQLLAAWGAARIITHRDKGRQKMRRQMWTKIET
ncbi:MAG: phytoene dehydrogenase [Myxococcales bacterium]|nr:phytoene dehydrogenase [Myxococcales bacterium]